MITARLQRLLGLPAQLVLLAVPKINLTPSTTTTTSSPRLHSSRTLRKRSSTRNVNRMAYIRLLWDLEQMAPMVPIQIKRTCPHRANQRAQRRNRRSKERLSPLCSSRQHYHTRRISECLPLPQRQICRRTDVTSRLLLEVALLPQWLTLQPRLHPSRPHPCFPLAEARRDRRWSLTKPTSTSLKPN